jgi:hypothetical protein
VMVVILNGHAPWQSVRETLPRTFVPSPRCTCGKPEGCSRCSWTRHARAACSDRARGPRLTAIGASAAISFDESDPFLRSECAVRSTFPRAVTLLLRPTDFRMRTKPSRLDDVDLRPSSLVRRTLVFAISIAAEIGIALSPTAHRVARLLRIALHPLRAVRALSFRILVSHARSDTERAFALQ